MFEVNKQVVRTELDKKISALNMSTDLLSSSISNGDFNSNLPSALQVIKFCY